MTRLPKADAVRLDMMLSIGLLMLGARAAHGQSNATATPLVQGSSPADSIRGGWLTLGASVGAADSPTGREVLMASAAGHGQWGARTGSLRFDAISNLSEFEINDLGVLVGRATTGKGPEFAALSVGLAGVRRRDCLKNCGLFSSGDPQFGPWRRGLGVSLAGDVALRAGGDGGFGVGLTTFASLNHLKSFDGAELQISVGQWH